MDHTTIMNDQAIQDNICRHTWVLSLPRRDLATSQGPFSGHLNLKGPAANSDWGMRFYHGKPQVIAHSSNQIFLFTHQLGEGVSYLDQVQIELILSSVYELGYQALFEKNLCTPLVILDQRRSQLVIWQPLQSARSIYWAQTNELFLFSPSLSALLATGKMAPQVSLSAMAEYLYFGALNDDTSFFENINKSVPGHCLVHNLINGKRLQIHHKPAITNQELAQIKAQALELPLMAYAKQLDLTLPSSWSNPLYALWMGERPRHDLFTLYSPHHRVCHFLRPWLCRYHYLKCQSLKVKKRNLWPAFAMHMLTKIELYSSLYGLLKLIRYSAHKLSWLPQRDLCKGISSLCVFSDFNLSLIFEGLYQHFSPYIWLQQQIGKKIATGTEHPEALQRVLLFLSINQAVPDIAYAGLLQQLDTPITPWHDSKLQQALINATPIELEKVIEKMPMPPITHSFFEQTNLLEALRAVTKGSLVDESIVPVKTIYAIINILKKSNSGKPQYLRAQKQATTLIALELWIRLFIDRHGEPIDPQISWQELLL